MYHTDLTFSNAGMGAIFSATMVTLETLVLNNTKINNKITPRIIWNLPAYSETKDNNENIFDNYFELVGFPAINENSIYTSFPQTNYASYKNPRMPLNQVYKDHVRVKPIIMDKVNAIFKGYENYYILGIHLRNTDKITEPQYLTPGLDKMLNHLSIAIEETLKEHSHIVLFVASDNIPDAEFIKIHVKALFPSLIILEDPNTIRSPNQTSIHGGADVGLQGISNAKKAETILTDIFCLARCHKVVRTCSNVTIAAALINSETIFIDVNKIYGKLTDWIFFC
jgi:hypothetical protein